MPIKGSNNPAIQAVDKKVKEPQSFSPRIIKIDFRLGSENPIPHAVNSLVITRDDDMLSSACNAIMSSAFLLFSNYLDLETAFESLPF